ncbi:ComEC/Rec2 family competence protein [Pedobacter sp. JY14-1]|uniref:ComEC/Rec2 family competence protein n=1 Tax=Pedobacter sp. JY14-1 TaxID=3034151 RepID=UPI0023E0D341|nr:ComEC/Rec2 family competence protein [Pedobacter sp. JY14-1]
MTQDNHTDRAGEKPVFAVILFPYCIGVLTAYEYASAFLLHYQLVLYLAVFGVLIGIQHRHHNIRVFHRRYSNALIFYLFWYLTGSIACLLHTERIRPDHFSRLNAALIRAEVTEAPVVKKGYVRFIASVSRVYYKKTVSGRLRLYTLPSCGHLLVSMQISSQQQRMPAYGEEFIAVARFRNIISAAPASFDYRAYMAGRNVHHRLFLQKDRTIWLSRNKGNWLTSFSLRLRGSQETYYRKVFSHSAHAAFASALILGQRANLDQATLTSYTQTGTIHALSVSGMHVGVIYLVLNTLLWFMDRNLWMKVLRALFMIILIWFYALLTGLSPSVLRAAVMISVMIAARLGAKQVNSTNILAFAAFTLLVYEPLLIMDIGFQLSFIAVGGLIWLQPVFERYWSPRNRVLRKIWSAVAMSLAAQLATTPLSIYYFHQFPVFFLVSNLFIAIPVALLMYIGIAILLFRVTWLCPLFEWLTDFMNTGLNSIASLPCSVVHDLRIGKALVLLIYIVLAAFCSLLHAHRQPR